jgi:L-lactate dehydrogenase complex protein LldG
MVWVALIAYAGYLFGTVPVVKENLTLVIFAIIVLSISPAIIEVLRHKGLTIVDPKRQTGETAPDAGVGLTSVDHAIAETGTLVLACAPGRSRAVSLLPPRHVAVLPEDRIRSDLFELIDALGRPLPSALTFITGPSRTADIGLTLVRGAHGPMAVTIFVVSP